MELPVIDAFSGQYAFLSNFSWINVSAAGPAWTVEHHYQAAKTIVPEWAARILAAPTPHKAKKLGRKAPMNPDWEDNKISVMLTLLRIKFSNYDLRQALLGTGEIELIEGNYWHDTFWGVCDGNCKKGPHEPDGENWLGVLLMHVRTELGIEVTE